ncbi:hypothetical protein TBLA_0E00160 [Henningerozyma blattae CBS 6284]|uniref:3',5'-cyclic-nucleotide phosphodiesterase n=1 Tax=Henningerozyma blattae (strain ATCC 34711 / CBS 6284 / DSM 70876 / NBRC 10599 / NRRL Y-10934 / UCD 77-7) TaxID=1071380 RepID=I2H3X7_HENB6|nr:hypothetical protein TBLA_0E00160 [Tetrapisispora blattae CBS 6284]CCH61079.1 hypothetical protein TBLA_0E00160 [Tetrapisispora blattae CBS 6284]
MPSFDVTIIGALGGPQEGDTQCLMVRPYGYQGLGSICLDAGAGLTSIIHILADCKKYKYQDSELFKLKSISSFYNNDYEPAWKFFNPDSPIGFGFPQEMRDILLSKNLGQIQKEGLAVFQGINEYYITHSHLDHICGMVTNSPSAFEKHFPSRKSIFGLNSTIQSLKRNIFNDEIWPDLTMGNKGGIILNELHAYVPQHSKIFENFEIIPLPVCHGKAVNPPNQIVFSTLYLFKNLATNDCILIGGDMQSDNLDSNNGPNHEEADNNNVSYTNKIKNGQVTIDYLQKAWEYVVENVPLINLKGIFIECSSSMDVNKSHLYGHMSPIFLINELKNFVNLYKQRWNLSEPPDLDLDVVIMHVKMSYSEIDPRLKILDEIKTLAAEKGIKKTRFSMALKGFTFSL